MCLITAVNPEPGRGESRGSLETMGHQPHPKQQQAPGEVKDPVLKECHVKLYKKEISIALVLPNMHTP